MTDHNITDKQIINIDNAHYDDREYQKCILMSILSEDKITSIIYHQAWNKFIGLNVTLIDSINDINFNDYYNQRNKPLNKFRNVCFVYDTPDFIILKNKEQTKETNEPVLNLIHGEKVNQNVLVDNIFDYDISIVYRLQSSTHYNIVKSCLYADYWHINCLFIKSILKNLSSYDQETDFIRLFLVQNSMTFIHIKDMKICFVQTYEMKSFDDVLFNVGNYLKLKKISKKELLIHISGYSLSEAEDIEYCRKFFPHIEFINRPLGFEYDRKFDHFPNHYFSLFFEIFWAVL